MHMNMDMKENEPMREFTIQHQIEHVLVVAMAQLYSLKKRRKEFRQEERNALLSKLQQHHDAEI